MVNDMNLSESVLKEFALDSSNHGDYELEVRVLTKNQWPIKNFNFKLNDIFSRRVICFTNYYKKLHEGRKVQYIPQ